jgi:sporulation protein YlmC with PRC-barrel domain
MHGIRLSRDVIDSQLVDRQGTKIGRVDQLLLELEDGEPPRVATIVIGGAARAERIGGWFAALRRGLRTLTGRRTERESRIPFAAVRRVAETIEVDVDAATLEAGYLERWLAEHVVRHIPGGNGERK